MFDMLQGVMQAAERCRRQDGTEAQLVGRVPAQAARSRCLTREHAAAKVWTGQHYLKRATVAGTKMLLPAALSAPAFVRISCRCAQDSLNLPLLASHYSQH